MNKILLFIVPLLFSINATGQQNLEKLTAKNEFVPDTVRPWIISGIFSLNLNQTIYSNWSAGGETAIGFNALLNLKADYKKGMHSWMNNLDIAYGFQINAIGSFLEQYRKTDDKFDLTTSYGYQLHPKWDLSALANFKTQFEKGYKYPDDYTVISDCMAPGYLIVGIGVTYKPKTWFSLYMSPASARLTFVMDQKLADQGAFGVDSSENIKFEFGPYVRAAMNKDVTQNINITSTLELFSNYIKKFGNIDVNWNLLITLKVNKFLATTISTQIIYDDDIMITDLKGKTGPRTQFRENIGVGISYKIR